MKPTLSDCLKIDSLAKDARKAVDDFVNACLTLAMECSKSGNQKSSDWLFDIVRRIDDRSLTFPDTTIQSEWMGGPTSGPGSENTKTYLRVPEWAGKSRDRHHFTADEVIQAVRDGYLKNTGDDLTGPKK